MYPSGFQSFLLTFLPYFSAFCMIVAVVLVFVAIFREPIREARRKKQRKERHLDMRNRLLTKYEGDVRFTGGTIYECATGYFMTIAETGYIEFNTPRIFDYVCHIKDINGFELIKDGYSNAPDIGAASIGRMMYGDVGAVIGGLGYSKQRVGRISVMFKINDFKHSLIEMKFLDEKIDTNSYNYEAIINQTQKIFSQLDVLDRKYREEHEVCMQNK